MVNPDGTTTVKRLFITGASGCIGHYIAERLIQTTDYDLYFLVRNPAKLQFDVNARPGVTVLQGDLRDVEQFGDLLKTVHCAILTAAAWGDPQETTEINVVKTIRVMNLLDPEVCEQVIYFSTASILDRQNRPLEQAKTIGTDYIRSKYECHQQLSQLAIAPRITTLFPTLVFGGGEHKPYSHLSAGLPQVLQWMGLIRFFGADASFHFLHAYDIAQVVCHLVDHPDQYTQEMVLGNPRLTANQAVEQFCAYLNYRIYFRIPLSTTLAHWLTRLLRFQMAEWDRFSLTYRHFTHKNPVSPDILGMTTAYPTLVDILKDTGYRKSA